MRGALGFRVWMLPGVYSALVAVLPLLSNGTGMHYPNNGRKQGIMERWMKRQPAANDTPLRSLAQ